jgi:protein-S-isoprenylcysteine O-methyltransferase Ste14
MTATSDPTVEPAGPGWRASARFVAYPLLLPVVLFGAAGRLDWGMGWLYVLLLSALTYGTRLVLMRVDPSLVVERSTSLRRPDAKPWDRALVLLMVLVGPLVTWLVAGLDQRFGWGPRVPGSVQIVAVVVIVLGGLLTAWAMVSNRFFSAVVRIQSDRGHHVVTTGPYRFIRHPGYVGALLATLAAPLMLDALWAMAPTLVVVVAVVVRTALEDATLRDELAGYAEYSRHTRYRLLPGVW